jgi:hypothetical protein
MRERPHRSASKQPITAREWSVEDVEELAGEVINAPEKGCGRTRDTVPPARSSESLGTSPAGLDWEGGRIKLELASTSATCSL